MILVTGATGLSGTQIVRRLSAEGVPVRALVRSPAKAAELALLPNVEVVEGDMGRPGTLATAVRGIDRAMLISSSDPMMQNVQTNLIDAARTAGVRHIVKLSGIMPELDSPFRFARMHGQIERSLEESGMAFTHLRAGEFMTAYFRQVPSIVAKGALFLPLEDARIASIDVADVVEVAVKVLTGPGHEGMTYPPDRAGSADHASEVAARLSAVTGKPVRYVDIPPEDATRARLAAGMSPYMAEALDELFAERRRGKESTVSPMVGELLGRPATSFAAFAERNAAVFRGERPPPKV